MKKKVVTMEAGSESATTKVLQPSRRNRKMIRIARKPPITASILTSLMAWRMNCDWSSMVVNSASGGTSVFSCSNLAWIASAVATVLASPSL